MSFENLGQHFDIHGGGPDLLFPHHENEIAQSECSSGHKFANYWLHSGLLKINGEKMSKSLGNFAMLKDLFISYHPEVLRYYLISSHYRSSLNFDQESLNQARSALTRLYQALALVQVDGSELDQDMIDKFSLVMDDDLNTPEALSVLFQLAKLINSSSDTEKKIKYASTLKELSGVLGLLQDDPKIFFQFGATLSDEEIDQKISLRNEARDTKNFETADKIRDSLLDQGIILDDSSEGTTWKKS
jgi:cysteinyl-tRNA synthetase